ncbi:hypothetical protein [Actinoplanes sp. NPDC026619]|uniref:poly(ethylene terephthalate) hydrolase family protein n=1 Tax=Actinoplanes sp. NPDC026619 TaxID=3155798 RepID=UPI0034077013
MRKLRTIAGAAAGLALAAAAVTLIPRADAATNSFQRGPAPSAASIRLELTGASHFAPNIPNTTIASTSVAWLKRFVDADTRFEQFICPGPSTGATVSQYEVKCPLG